MLLCGTRLLSGLFLASTSAMPVHPTREIVAFNRSSEILTCYDEHNASNKALLKKAVPYMCKKHTGFQLGNGNKPASLVEIAQAKHGVVVMRVDKLGEQVAGCNYTIGYDECMFQLSKPANLCYTTGGGNLTDLECGMDWSIEVMPQSTDALNDIHTASHIGTEIFDSNAESSSQTMRDRLNTLDRSKGIVGHGFAADVDIRETHAVQRDDPSGMDVGPWTTADVCYDSGFQWTREMLVEGVDKFCYWAHGSNMQTGAYLNYTMHYCIDGTDHLQWYYYQVTQGTVSDLQYSICMLGVIHFIDDCNTVGVAVKQGGYGINDAGSLAVDGDPNVHNPGKAEGNKGCGDIKIAAQNDREQNMRTFGSGKLEA